MFEFGWWFCRAYHRPFWARIIVKYAEKIVHVVHFLMRSTKTILYKSKVNLLGVEQKPHVGLLSDVVCLQHQYGGATGS